MAMAHFNMNTASKGGQKFQAPALISRVNTKSWYCMCNRVYESTRHGRDQAEWMQKWRLRVEQIWYRVRTRACNGESHTCVKRCPKFILSCLVSSRSQYAQLHSSSSALDEGADAVRAEAEASEWVRDVTDGRYSNSVEAGATKTGLLAVDADAVEAPVGTETETDSPCTVCTRPISELLWSHARTRCGRSAPTPTSCAACNPVPELFSSASETCSTHTRSARGHVGTAVGGRPEVTRCAPNGQLATTPASAREKETESAWQ